MNLTFCNVTAEDGDVSNEENLSIGITFHALGLLLSAAFTAFAVALSMFLIFMHATHYSEPREQRYIIRILFMVPVYAIVSFLSFLFWRHSVYFEVIRDCYEAFAIASFFSLMCAYVAEELHDQKNYFRTITPIPWIWPAKWGKWSMFRTPRSGLTWFNIIWFCIFQYCVVRVVCTILAVITQAAGRYCIASESPYFAHVWVSVIEAIAVTIAMVCLIQFYAQLKQKLAPFNPLGKLLAIKLVIFLCFWQTFLLSALTSETANVINPGPHVSQPDLSVGIPALAVCGEMAIFAVMHVFVYGWKPYARDKSISMQLENQNGSRRDKYYGGPLGVMAYADAFNPIDILRAVGRGFRWMFVGRKTREQDVSYQNKGTAGQGPTLGPLSTLGKTGKYQKLDDDGDDQVIPLNSQPAAMGRTESRPAEYSMSNFHQPAPNPFDLTAPERPDISRTPSPYEAYRAQRQSRSNSVAEGLGSRPVIAQDHFEPVPTIPTAPTPTPMHPSHGQVPYPVDSREEAMLGQDTGYHRGENANPWGSNRL